MDMQEALESSGTLDDSQWLTYWLLSAFLTIIERFGYRVLFMLPFYAEMKLALLAWLVLPYFNGASMIYDNARPYLIDFYNALRQTTDELRDEAENKGAPNHCLLGQCTSACTRFRLPFHSSDFDAYARTMPSAAPATAPSIACKLTLQSGVIACRSEEPPHAHHEGASEREQGADGHVHSRGQE